MREYHELKTTEAGDLGASEHTGRLKESNGVNSESAGAQGDTTTPNYGQDG